MEKCVGAVFFLFIMMTNFTASFKPAVASERFRSHSCQQQTHATSKRQFIFVNQVADLDGDNIETLANPTRRNGVLLASFGKVLFGGTLAILMAGAPFMKMAEASTAPAAQAMAAAEASGKSIEELVPEEAPKITSKSSPRAIKVGKRLEALNAKMYGAFWCSHCNNQKQELGVEVAKQFEYIECDKDGANTQYKLCRSTKITGYPTWEIQGELYPGEKDLGELETLLTSIERSTPPLK